MDKQGRIAESLGLETAPASDSSWRRHFNSRFAIHALLLGILTLLAYIPALHCGYIWDDDIYVTTNALLRSLNGLQRIWFQIGATPQYYPFVHSSFWIEYHLWGLNPFGYHLVNIFLHALNAILVWLLLRRLEVRGAWLAAAIFALHPVHVESVAWVTERKNVLSGIFYLSAALAYLRFEPVLRMEVSDTATMKWRAYWLAFGLYACALLSKSVTCTLPAAVLLLIWWKRGRLRWREMAPLVPFFVLGGIMGLNTAWMEKHRVGAVGSEFALSLVERCLIASRALWFYTLKLVWPQNLIFIYPRWQIDPTALWQWVFVPATAITLATLWMLRGKLGRGPLVAVLFFAITLAPALGFIDVYPFRYSFVADHFQYLASIGIIALGVATAGRVLRRPSARVGTSGLVLAVLGLLTWRHCAPFRDEETLWRDTIAKNKSCWMAYDNLGHLLQHQGKLSEAITQYKQALLAKPDDELAHNNWANALLTTGDVHGAIGHFEQALRIKPDFIEAQNNWGNALLREGKIREAITHYEQALESKPDFAEAHYNIGRALQQEGKLGEAIERYKRALQFDPNFAEAHNNLGEALRQQGKIEEAIAHYEQALQITPDYAEAHYNLGIALAQTGKLPEAMAQYEETLKINPGYAAAHNNLGNLLLQARRIDSAIGHFEQALRIDPDYVAAHNNLGNALVQAGRLEGAVRQYELALRTSPGSAVGHYNLANILLQVGRSNDAVAHYQEALRLDPNFTQAREMLVRLRGSQ